MSDLLDALCPATDPAHARRRQLLDTLLAGAAALAALVLAVTFVLDRAASMTVERAYLLAPITLAISALAWAINRRGESRLASALFLALLTLVLLLVDAPRSVLAGRSLVMFSFPILMASFLCRAWASFVLAGASSALLIALSLLHPEVPLLSFSSILALFAVALVSWLAAHSLEQALRDLRQSEGRFRRMAESIQDGLTIVESGRVAYLNRRLCQITGRSREELLTMNELDLAAPEERERLHRMLGTDPPPADLTFWIVRPDGSRRCIRNRYAVNRRAGDAVDRYVVTTDVTERRHIEAHLRQAQKMEAMGRLAAGVAHDFNNYMAVIGSYTDLLWMDAAGPMRDDLAHIKTALNRAEQLTTRLLAFSRRRTLDPELLDINAVIRAIEAILCRLAGPEIEVMTAYAPGRVLVQAVQADIERVLVNLVSNAHDAIQESAGTISIRTALVEGDRVLIEIGDTGAGMSDEVQAHLFEPFFTTKAPGRGTGLGLPTVYDIIRQCGGKIEVDSEPGRGTTFKIYLPRAGRDDIGGTSGPD